MERLTHPTTGVLVTVPPEMVERFVSLGYKPLEEKPKTTRRTKKTE
jgi:hypothetical protein|nr:MAG TPA: hypothetical protein [Caudoviricetes sp.]